MTICQSDLSPIFPAQKTFHPLGTVGLLVPLVPKPERTEDVSKFIFTGYSIVSKNEPRTLQWYGLKEPATDQFAVFDTFGSEEGRQAHAEGDVATALAASSSELLGQTPSLEQVDILERIVKAKASSPSDMTAGLTKGLIVRFASKPDKVDALKKFLVATAYLHADAEPETLAWYAIHYPGTNNFGIVDFFPDEAARTAHLQGNVPSALAAAAEDLLSSKIIITYVDVLAAKV